MVGEQQVGPIPQDQIEELFQSEKLPVTTLVWTEGLKGWVQAQGLEDSESTSVSSPLPPEIEQTTAGGAISRPALVIGKSSVKRRSSLTKRQLAEKGGAELLQILCAIGEDGKVTDDEIVDFKAWLNEHRHSDIPAISTLSETVDRILADCMVTEDERLELILAIERVLPVAERRMVRKARLGEPTSASPDDRVLTLQDLKETSRRTAKEQKEAAEDDETGPEPYDWRIDPATDRQRDYIKALGGRLPINATKGEASNLIESLLGNKPPTNRQLMVLRFWGLKRQSGEGPREIGEWQNTFYIEDPDRKRAWELYKEEAEDDGRQGDPQGVPFGVGPKYLARIKQGGTAAVARLRTSATGRRNTGGRWWVVITALSVVVVLIVLAQCARR
jgi:hypothetical protein